MGHTAHSVPRWESFSVASEGKLSRHMETAWLSTIGATPCHLDAMNNALKNVTNETCRANSVDLNLSGFPYFSTEVEFSYGSVYI